MNLLRPAIAISLLLGLSAFAQERRMPPPPRPGSGFDVAFQGGDFVFLRAEFGMEGKLVKGSPYSAQVVTEVTQALGDGNRIHRTTSATVARDSEGRTRREESIASIGPLAASGAAPKPVFIHDPVAGVSYTLDTNNRQARMTHNRPPFHWDSTPGQGVARDKAFRPPDQRTKMRAGPSQSDRKTEDLGSRVMENVTVQGKRVTHTIPAGQIGNERPLEIVSETWYSPELQAVVMSKTSDPRTGEMVYKLTNISRAEPDPTLFQVPANFTVTEDRPAGDRPNRMQK